MSNKNTRFDIYDIIRVIGNSTTQHGIITDYDYIPDGDNPIVTYKVYQGGKYFHVRESDTEKVGHVDTEFNFGDQVIVILGDQETGRITNCKGVVDGISYNPATNDLGFTVDLENGDYEFFSRFQLKRNP